MKQKKMIALALGLLALILVVLPFVISAAAPGTWQCPEDCGGFGTCSGDVMWETNCYMYCRTESTTTDPVDCFWWPN